ncbi:MAG: class I SAM-dependent methyltransferase [Acidobacteriota bacterium]
MRPHIRELIRLATLELDLPEPIVEVGALSPPGQEEMANLRPFFVGRDYVGCDMQPGPGVDRVEDLHGLTFADGEVGTFVLADTFEHVRDPQRAMAEVRRALQPGGVVIFTSVFAFPIHDYPNDYWRFTPEAFRALAEPFRQAAIFYAGEPLNPHTVAGVAVDSAEPGVLDGLAEALRRVVPPAPLHLERHAALQIRHLAATALGERIASEPARDHAACALLPPFEAPGWTLVEGQWCQGWTTAQATRAVVRSSRGTLLEEKLAPMAAPVQAAFGLAVDPGRRWFRRQVRLEPGVDVAGGLELALYGADGALLASCRSAPGLLLGSIEVAAGFELHSLDVRADAPRSPGDALVEAIRGRGEEVVVDLGCGFRKEGNIGIDLSADGRDVDLICKLGFEDIPLADGVVDKVFCRDFLEHLPKAVYIESRGGLVYPVIDLINEVWRILRPGGLFESLTPVYPHPEVHQDPTHLSAWTMASMKYFCGVYPIAEHYGVEADFELVENREQDFYLYALLRKPDDAGA